MILLTYLVKNNVKHAIMILTTVEIPFFIKIIKDDSIVLKNL